MHYMQYYAQVHVMTYFADVGPALPTSLMTRILSYLSNIVPSQL